jgi:lipoprotein NlpD
MKSSTIVLCLFALGLAACASRSPAPIVDRSGGATRTAPAAPAPTAAAPTAGRDAARTYTVQRGDTLRTIATSQGVSVADLVRWNALPNPNVIEVGQVLRLGPPPASDAAAPATAGGAVASTAPVSPTGSVEARPLDAPASGAGAVRAEPAKPAEPARPADAAKPVEPAKPAEPARADASIALAWPAKGPILEGFGDGRNKGVDIGGKDGDPVLAAADGEVFYVGASLPQYGNLVIIKHPDDFITVYAHNRSVLVKQGQTVKRGQRVAEMGKSGTDRTKLHFELRRQGTPVDPMRYLPTR